MPVPSGKSHHRYRHGQAGWHKKTRVYAIWCGMMNRCQNPNNRSYDRYGGRGIKVCERWQDFANFYADMGDPPSGKHQLERNRNGDGYQPDNCRWATPKEQSNNRRSSRLIEMEGVTMTLAGWCEKYSIKHNTVLMRVRYGWNLEQAIKTPVGSKRPGSEGTQ